MPEPSRPLLTRASQIRPGDELCLDNLRLGYIVANVARGRLGEVRVGHGEGTAVDCFNAADWVWVRKGGR